MKKKVLIIVGLIFTIIIFYGCHGLNKIEYSESKIFVPKTDFEIREIKNQNRNSLNNFFGENGFVEEIEVSDISSLEKANIITRDDVTSFEKVSNRELKEFGFIFGNAIRNYKKMENCLIPVSDTALYRTGNQYGYGLQNNYTCDIKDVYIKDNYLFFYSSTTRNDVFYDYFTILDMNYDTIYGDFDTFVYTNSSNHTLLISPKKNMFVGYRSYNQGVSVDYKSLVNIYPSNIYEIDNKIILSFDGKYGLVKTEPKYLQNSSMVLEKLNISEISESEYKKIKENKISAYKKFPHINLRFHTLSVYENELQLLLKTDFISQKIDNCFYFKNPVKDANAYYDNDSGYVYPEKNMPTIGELCNNNSHDKDSSGVVLTYVDSDYILFEVGYYESYGTMLIDIKNNTIMEMGPLAAVIADVQDKKPKLYIKYDGDGSNQTSQTHFIDTSNKFISLDTAGTMITDWYWIDETNAVFEIKDTDMTGTFFSETAKYGKIDISKITKSVY